MSGVALVAHSGGPTAVINASLVGLVEEARLHREITGLYGSRFGIAGILNRDFLDLFQQSSDVLSRVGQAPSSALGTSRREVSLDELLQVIDVFRAYSIRYFFYTGGNGSMGIASQLQKLAGDQKYDVSVIGIPKTIDNDLMETDHTPGYGSAARFFACAAQDIGADARALGGQVEILEVLGRNVGWLSAATSLARFDEDDPPHLIYFPENRLPLDKLLEDVSRVYGRLGYCSVSICEGQLDEHGEPFGADVRSGSRGSLAMNLGHRLATLITSRLKLRARSEKPGLLGRSNGTYVSAVDRAEAWRCGQKAAQVAVEGERGKMVTISREFGSSYEARMETTDLEKVAFLERPFPSAWMNKGQNDVLPEFRSYAAPLAGSMAAYGRLTNVPIAPES